MIDHPVPPEIHVDVRLKQEVSGFAHTFLERLVMRLGPPERVNKACDRFVFWSLGVTAVYIVAWFLFVTLAVAGKPSLTDAQASVLALAWAPMLALQLGAGAVRYTSFVLSLRLAENHMALATEGFHELVNQAVGSAVANFMANYQPPEKPTIQ